MPNSESESVAFDSPEQASLGQLTDEVEAHIQRLTVLDLESVCIRRAIRELNTRRNRFVLISRLPAEVLAMVFMAYVADHWKAYTSPRAKDELWTPPYQWLAILHVNQDWRRAAVTTKALWTTFVPTRPACVKFMLEHAGQLPLQIRLGSPPDYFLVPLAEEANCMVLAELGRMRIAQLRVTQGVYKHLAAMEEEGLGTRELMVQELLLDVVVEDAESLPLLSVARMPQLTTLKVYWGLPALVISLNFPTLTSLHWLTPYELLLDDLRSTLSHFSLLQHLHLDLSLSFYVGFDNITIELPRLRTLSIEGAPRQVALLFRSLIFPQDTSVRLIFTDDGFQDWEIPHTVAWVAEKIARMRETTSDAAMAAFCPRSILLDTDPLFVQLSAETSNSTVAEVWDKPRFCLSIENNDLDEEAIANFMTCFFKPLNLSDVVDMRIGLELSTVTWSQFLQAQRIPNLENLRLTGLPVTEAFLGALTTPLPPSADHPNNSPSPCLFPKLKRLDMMSLDLHIHPDHPSEHDFMPRLETMLKRRLDLAAPLEKLFFINCNHVNDEDLEILNDLLLHPELHDSSDGRSRCSHDEHSDAVAGPDA
ncbi:hypothetical protein NM688_g5821 [Phlebia brevispora]|uniref:Uncharacterized protein n=1 Tax=Phlebia brevispora TaxID=194682 RepID=A0ACC1SPA9_9APHY|nr:hypothetical protein NM688_g5821 [Phlebia brevispora]